MVQLQLPPPLPRAVHQGYVDALERAYAAGTVKPVVSTRFFIGLILLLAYLCFDHRQRTWLRLLRYPLFGTEVFLYGKMIMNTSSVNVASAFGVGLASSWMILWSWIWLILRDPQVDAKRIERRRKAAKTFKGDGTQHETGSVTKATSTMNSQTKAATGELHQRHSSSNVTVSLQSKTTSEPEYEYFWQSYPEDSIATRVNWVLDLILNFRGMGWDWEIATTPSWPPHIKVGLGEAVDLQSMQLSNRVGVRRYPNRDAMTKARIVRFIVCLFLLDLCKTLVMKDPYFVVGPNNYALPPYLAGLSPLYLKVYRELISMLCVCTALETIFLLAPITFSIIMGERLLGTRAEVWMYPTTMGSFSTVLDTGLSGFWGGFWHQTFRYGFSAPVQYLLKRKVIQPKSAATKFLGLLCAFTISGLLHAGGSMTQPPTTNALEPILFFLSQGLGILIQNGFCSLFSGPISQMPASVKKAANFSFTFTWLYYTSPLLLDDFARGGIWMFEPLPISLLRGLGFGVEGDGWWCWDGLDIHWVTGKSWLDTGIAF